MFISSFALLLAVSAVRFLPTVATDDESAAPSPSPGKKRRTTRKKREVGALRHDSEVGAILLRCFLNWLENKRGPSDFAIDPRNFNLSDISLYERFRATQKGQEPLGLRDDDIYTQSSLLDNLKKIADIAISQHNQRGRTRSHEQVHGPKDKRKTPPGPTAAPAASAASSAAPPPAPSSAAASSPRPSTASSAASSSARPSVQFNTTPQPSVDSSPRPRPRPRSTPTTPLMESLDEALPAGNPAIMAAFAEHQRRPLGNNDGGGQIEHCDYDHDITITDLAHRNNVISTGCQVMIHCPSGMEVTDFEFTVTEAESSGLQFLQYSHDKIAALKDPQRTTSSYIVPHPDATIAGNIQVYPAGSANGAKIERTASRRAANRKQGAVPLPFPCERAIVPVMIQHPSRGTLEIDKNPDIIPVYHPLYANCPDNQKKEELKRRGMQMILVVHLRKANDTGRKMAGKGNTTKVTTSPTASTEDDPYAY